MGVHTRQREAEELHGQFVKKSSCILVGVLALLVGVFIGNALTMLYVGQRDGREAAMSGGSVPQMPPAQGAQSAPHAADPAALGSLEAATVANPTDADAWVELGNYCFDHDLPAKAAAAYEHAVELSPMRPGVWSDLGVMYRRLKEFDKAIGAFEHAANLDKTHVTARFNMGVVYLHDLGDRDGALRAWKMVLDIDPEAKTPSGQSVADLMKELGK
jgi:cytochrome c-type biogenesis protein CcmH/NrfG